MLAFAPLGSYPLGGSGGYPPADLADSFGVSGAFTADALANLIDRLNATGSISLNATLQGTATSGVTFLDSVLTAWNMLLTENIATTGDALGSIHKLAALVDALAATGQADGQMTAFAACAAAIALEGLIRQNYSVALADQAALTESATAVARLLAPLLDSLALSADATPMLRLSAISADSVTIAADPSTLLRANADLSDGVLLYVSLRIGGADYAGWVLNTTNSAASEYRNLTFDSFASYRGKHYAAGAHGIVKFGGDSDDGTDIDAWLRTTLTHFGTNKHKRCPDAYIGCSASGDLVIKTITRDPATGVQNVDWYDVVRKQELGPGQGRAQIGRGLKSTWWSFEIHNKAGADFAIDSIELKPLVLDRRT